MNEQLIKLKLTGFTPLVKEDAVRSAFKRKEFGLNDVNVHLDIQYFLHLPDW